MYYIELTLIPNPEVDVNFLWSKCYAQIHLALVEEQNSDGKSSIGCCFPEYQHLGPDRTLGNKLRLITPTQQNLENLHLREWLKHLSDYVHISKIRPVPEQATHCVRVIRWREGASKEALMRRYAKRKSCNEEHAQSHFDNYNRSFNTAPPFIRIQSLSGGKRHYRLYVSQRSAEPTLGQFNTYGLSNDASPERTAGPTVPFW